MKTTFHVLLRPEEGSLMTCEAELPFVPQVGMWMSVLPEDNFRQVESVYWDQKTGITIFFKGFEPGERRQQLLKFGWRPAPEAVDVELARILSPVVKVGDNPSSFDRVRPS